MPGALRLIDRALSKRGLLTAGALSAAVLTALGLARTRPEPSTVAENKALVRRLIEEVFNTGDDAHLDELADARLAADVRQGLFGVLRAAFPDLRYTVERLVGEGERVVYEVRGRGTHRGRLTHPAGTVDVAPTGRRIQWQEVHVLRIEHGKAVREGGALDALEMVRQLGARITLPPAPGGTAR
jgi:predicted ester cyclase